MPRENLPIAALQNIEPSKVQTIVTDLMQLHEMGVCATDEETEDRIRSYFELCRNSSVRPGIESLATALHVSRITIWNWANGIGCSPRKADAIRAAKSMIAAFIEQASLSGQINPVTSIFFLKNWFSYKDSYMFEQERPYTPSAQLTPEQIARKIEQDIPLPEGLED